MSSKMFPMLFLSARGKTALTETKSSFQDHMGRMISNFSRKSPENLDKFAIIAKESRELFGISTMKLSN